MNYTLEEHQAKKLISKDFQESRVIQTNIKEDDVSILQESVKGKGKRKLVVKMEAIHVGKTRNSTFYTEEGLKGGLSSWTQPYNKPVLTHHNQYDGEPIGRILEAEFSEQTLSGKPGLIFTVEITDEDAIEKVLDGRYQTVSIGATTDKVTCNICGTDRTEEWCDHYPGKKYDEQTCHFIIGNTYGREVSYVNTPSDEHARNFAVEVVENTDDGQTEEYSKMEIFQMAEGLYQDAKQPEVNLYEHLDEDVKKMIDLMTSVEVQEGSEEMPKDEMQEQENATEEVVDEKEEATSIEEENKEEAEIEEQNASTDEAEQTDLQERVQELQAIVSNLVLEKQKLESRLTTLEAENETLIQENAKLVEERHLDLTERVVDLKYDLRKADVIGVTREEAVQEHAKRTTESLEDTLKDLVVEVKKEQRPEPGVVKNPGLAEADDEDKKNDNYSLEEAESLLKKMFSRK